METTANPLVSQYKQPRELRTLFSIELWERFGFYAVQSLLVLFLSKVYHYSDAQAYDLFSAYSALIFATPIVGGFLADRYLGFRKAIFFGAILYIIGFAALASSLPALFHFALAFLICGNGFFKSCVSSLLGATYEKDDPRRDSGFTLFYMGINIGAMVAPIVCSWLATTLGWGYAFGAAGVGMLICLTIILTQFKKFGALGLPPNPQKLTKRDFLGFSQQSLIILGTLLVVGFISFLIQHATLTDYIFDVFGVLLVVVLVKIAFNHDAVQRKKIFALILLILFSVVFWAMFAQVFSSIVLFSERVVDRHIMNWEMPSSMLVSFEGFFVVVFAPIAAALWLRLKNSRWNLSTPGKFTLSLFLLSSAFLYLMFCIHLTAHSNSLNLVWLIAFYFLVALSELSISPIGLSMVTALAPPNLTGMFMGVWFLALTMGFALGDVLAKLTNIPKTLTDPIAISQIYGHVYTELGLGTLAIAVLALCLTPSIRRLAGETIN